MSETKTRTQMAYEIAEALVADMYYPERGRQFSLKTPTDRHRIMCRFREFLEERKDAENAQLLQRCLDEAAEATKFRGRCGKLVMERDGLRAEIERLKEQRAEITKGDVQEYLARKSPPQVLKSAHERKVAELEAKLRRHTCLAP